MKAKLHIKDNIGLYGVRYNYKCNVPVNFAFCLLIIPMWLNKKYRGKKKRYMISICRALNVKVCWKIIEFRLTMQSALLVHYIIQKLSKFVRSQLSCRNKKVRIVVGTNDTVK